MKKQTSTHSNSLSISSVSTLPTPKEIHESSIKPEHKCSEDGKSHVQETPEERKARMNMDYPAVYPAE